ncbi:MAG: hypothetical protein ACLFU9_06140 [Candidatus Bathyarchaeia archaeon]
MAFLCRNTEKVHTSPKGVNNLIEEEEDVEEEDWEEEDEEW